MTRRLLTSACHTPRLAAVLILLTVAADADEPPQWPVPPAAAFCARADQDHPELYVALFTRYVNVVYRYRHGDYGEAVSHLQSWPYGCLAKAARELRSSNMGPEYAESPCTEGCLRAAILLHLEAARAEPTLPGRRLQLHLGVARRLVETMAEAADDEVAARWLLLVGSIHLDLASLTDALSLFERARSRRPRDPTVLLALGMFYQNEALAAEAERLNQRPSLRPPPNALNETWQIALRAQTVLLEALRLDPDSEAVHLRLGHVLLLRRDLEKAASELGWVLEHGRDHRNLLSAHLLLGRIEESRGRDEEAVAHYRAATLTHPASRTAQIALATALFRAGDRTALETFRASLEALPEADLWISYRFARGSQDLEDFRATVAR